MSTGMTPFSTSISKMPTCDGARSTAASADDSVNALVAIAVIGRIGGPDDGSSSSMDYTDDQGHSPTADRVSTTYTRNAVPHKGSGVRDRNSSIRVHGVVDG